MSYEYDVFLSYRHRGQAMEWVRNHFYPMLEERLRDSLPVEHDLRIFIDFGEIETGSSWPAKLRQALTNGFQVRSGGMVARVLPVGLVPGGVADHAGTRTASGTQN